MYEGNLFAMAVQLDVTLQVLKDYQDIISTTGNMYCRRIVLGE